MNQFRKMLADNSGAAAAEYALILAIVGTGIAFAAFGLGTAIKNSMNNATKCINTTAPTSTSC